MSKFVTRSISCDGSITRPFWINRLGMTKGLDARDGKIIHTPTDLQCSKSRELVHRPPSTCVARFSGNVVRTRRVRKPAHGVWAAKNFRATWHRFCCDGNRREYADSGGNYTLHSEQIWPGNRVATIWGPELFSYRIRNRRFPAKHAIFCSLQATKSVPRKPNSSWKVFSGPHGVCRLQHGRRQKTLPHTRLPPQRLLPGFLQRRNMGRDDDVVGGNNFQFAIGSHLAKAGMGHAG